MKSHFFKNPFRSGKNQTSQSPTSTEDKTSTNPLIVNINKHTKRTKFYILTAFLVGVVSLPLIIYVTIEISDYYSSRQSDVAGIRDEDEDSTESGFTLNSKASGMVRLVCETPKGVGIKKVLEEGTILSTEDGLQFELVEDVSVVCPGDQNPRVLIRAIDVGYKYNIDTDIEMEIDGEDEISAMTVSIITGGRGVPKNIDTNEQTDEEELDDESEVEDDLIGDLDMDQFEGRNFDELSEEEQNEMLNEIFGKYFPDREGFQDMPLYMQEVYKYTDGIRFHLGFVYGMFVLMDEDNEDTENYIGLLNGMVSSNLEGYKYGGNLDAIPDEEVKKKVVQIEEGVTLFNAKLTKSTELMLRYHQSDDVEEMAELLDEAWELNDQASTMHSVVEGLCYEVEGLLDEERVQGV